MTDIYDVILVVPVTALVMLGMRAVVAIVAETIRFVNGRA